MSTQTITCNDCTAMIHRVCTELENTLHVAFSTHTFSNFACTTCEKWNPFLVPFSPALALLLTFPLPHPASPCLPCLPLLLCCCSSWDRACHRNVTGRRWWVSGLTDEAALLFPSLQLHSHTQTPAVQGHRVCAIILHPHTEQAATTLATHKYSSMPVSLNILKILFTYWWTNCWGEIYSQKQIHLKNDNHLQYYKRKYTTHFTINGMLHCVVCVFLYVQKCVFVHLTASDRLSCPSLLCLPAPKSFVIWPLLLHCLMVSRYASCLFAKSCLICSLPGAML